MRGSRMLRWAAAFVFAAALWLCCGRGAGASIADATWPEMPGIDVRINGKIMVDATNMAKGYVMVRVAQPTGNAFKMRVTYNGAQLMYDIDKGGAYMVCPLQMGSGNYELALFENVKGNKYSAEGSIALSAALSDENAAFLCPNQYVDYDRATQAAIKSDELCQGATGKAAYDIISDYIAGNFSYDFVRASTISSGALPEIDYCYENKMGICQDLAATMACMLRVQNVPARLMIGYADSYYHAWIVAIVDGQEVFFDPTAAIGALNASRYTVERYY